MVSQNNRDERGNIIQIKPMFFLSFRLDISSPFEIIKNANTSNLRSVLENIVDVKEWQFIDDTDAGFRKEKIWKAVSNVRRIGYRLLKFSMDKKWYAKIECDSRYMLTTGDIGAVQTLQHLNLSNLLSRHLKNSAFFV